MDLIVIILIFIFILGLIMRRLFSYGREIKQVLSEKPNVQKISGKEIFRQIDLFRKTALGFYRVMCEKFLYLDKKHTENELSSEKPQKEEERMVILEIGMAEDKIKENEMAEEILNTVSEKGESGELGDLRSDGSHYLPNDLREVLKKVLDEDGPSAVDPWWSIKVNEHEESTETESEEEIESENIALRRFKKRIKKVTKEIVNQETLDFEGVRRCEKAFAVIVCLRNGEDVMGSVGHPIVIQVPENDCVTALIAILQRLWVNNSPKDFLRFEMHENEFSQAISESMFHILNEAVLLYLFYYFFYKIPSTLTEYEMIENSQKHIIEILCLVNIHTRLFEKGKIYGAFSEEKIKVVMNEFQKIQWFSFPKDPRPFLKIFLTPEQKIDFFEHRNHLWRQSVLAEMKKLEVDVDAEVERQKVILEVEVRKVSKNSSLMISLAELNLGEAKKKMVEIKRIIQASSAKKIKTEFTAIDESVNNANNLLCQLKNKN